MTARIKKLVKDEIERAFLDAEHLTTFNTFTDALGSPNMVTEISGVESSGFIPYTNGGFEVNWLFSESTAWEKSTDEVRKELNLSEPDWSEERDCDSDGIVEVILRFVCYYPENGMNPLGNKLAIRLSIGYGVGESWVTSFDDGFREIKSLTFDYNKLHILNDLQVRNFFENCVIDLVNNVWITK